MNQIDIELLELRNSLTGVGFLEEESIRSIIGAYLRGSAPMMCLVTYARNLESYGLNNHDLPKILDKYGYLTEARLPYKRLKQSLAVKQSGTKMFIYLYLDWILGKRSPKPVAVAYSDNSWPQYGWRLYVGGKCLGSFRDSKDCCEAVEGHFEKIRAKHKN